MAQQHPLAEVFGFPITNLSPQAKRFRTNRLCPFNNKVPSCTKDKAKNPLGVCSIFDKDEIAITCPIRFREDWVIIENAARFLFPKNAQWTTLQEIRLNDANGRAAGNIDFVLIQYDQNNKIIDFGALEVQAVYISGNIRQPFEQFYINRDTLSIFEWNSTHVRADYLSSSRKRLVPQLLYKGSIIKAWNKKQVVVIQKPFFDTLPKLPEVEEENADMAWQIYDLKYSSENNKYQLFLDRIIFTEFSPSIDKITTPEPGSMEFFIDTLQNKLDEEFENNYPPDAPTLTDIISS